MKVVIVSDEDIVFTLPQESRTEDDPKLVTVLRLWAMWATRPLKTEMPYLGEFVGE